MFATARADTTISLAAIVALCLCGRILLGIVAALEKTARRVWGVGLAETGRWRPRDLRAKPAAPGRSFPARRVR